MPPDSMGLGSACMRKAAVLAEFFAEECADQDFMVREVEMDDFSTFVFVPAGLTQRARMASSSPIPASELVDMLQDSPWLAPWLGGVCSFSGVTADERDQLRECIQNFGGEALDEQLEVNDRAVDLVAARM